MTTPGGIPWYALVLQEQVLLAAGIAMVLALVGIIAWLGAKATGGAPSWRLNALVVAPLAALAVGGAAHWVQTRPLAGVQRASEWSFIPRDFSLPAATFWFSDNPAATPQRSLSLLVARPVEGGGGIRAKSPTFLPAHDPSTWTRRVAKDIRALYPELTEADATAKAAALTDWVSFLTSSPPPTVSQTQQRSTQGAYDIGSRIEPFERRRPWRLHWIVTIAIGVATMLAVTMLIRRRFASASAARQPLPQSA